MLYNLIFTLVAVLYALGLGAFLLGFKFMKRESNAHVVMFGMLCLVPVLVAALLQATLL